MPWRILVRDNPRSQAREEDRHHFEESAYQIALDLQLRLITDTNTRLTIKKTLPKNATPKQKLALIQQAIGGTYGYAQVLVEQTNTTASGRPMRRSAMAARVGLLQVEEDSPEEEEEVPEEEEEDDEDKKSSDMATPVSTEESSSEDDSSLVSEDELDPKPRRRNIANQEAEIVYKMRANTRSRRQMGSPMMRRRLSMEQEQLDEDEEEEMMSTAVSDGRWRIDSHNIIPQRAPQIIRLTNKVRRTMGPARFFCRG